ncbi:WSSV431 [White spot syndrome virus]|uniref:WSSV431 n=1 Tax=White spot syndrome virus TaxID=342409 RepID=A0A2I6SCA8_9VIRU|nr:WSSV431 [White spot syndrome virus]
MRAKGSPISSWSGTHPGLMAFLQIFNVSVKKVSQEETRGEELQPSIFLIGIWT